MNDKNVNSMENKINFVRDLIKNNNTNKVIISLENLPSSEIIKLDEHGRHLLGYAATANDLEIVRYIIEKKKIDVNLVNKFGATALQEAIVRSNFEIVKYLVNNGADVNIVSKSGATPLWWALDTKNIEIAKYLVSKGADLDYKHPKENFTLREWAKGEFGLEF